MGYMEDGGDTIGKLWVIWRTGETPKVNSGLYGGQEDTIGKLLVTWTTGETT